MRPHGLGHASTINLRDAALRPRSHGPFAYASKHPQRCWTALQAPLRHRQRAHASSSSDAETGQAAGVDHAGVAPHGEHPVGSIDAGGSQDAIQPAPAEVTLRGDPWAWRKHQLSQMGRFCGPALAIPLSDPLQSLVDNICVARFSGTLEVAALAPCTLIFSMGYVFNALSVAALSSVAEGIQAGDTVRAERALSSALFVGLILGLGVWALLQTQATDLIAWTGADKALWPSAMQYLRIRAMAAPAVLVTMCAQAGLLAQKDSVTPLIVVLFTSSINFLGDFLLIAKYGMGVRGAAWATAVSQILGAVVLLYTLRAVSKVKPALRVPSWHDLQVLCSTLGPMSLIYLCKNFTYIQIQLTATVLAPLTLAAHQLLYSLWSLTSFLTVPLEQAALAFLPSARDVYEAMELARLIVVVGSIAGICGGVIAAGSPLLVPQLFTHDVALHPIMRSVLPQVFLAMLLCGCDVSCTGLLVAKKDMKFLVRAMFITVVGSWLVLTTVQSRGWGLHGVWWGLCFFFASRAAQSIPQLLKLFSQERRAHEREAEASIGLAAPSN